MLVSKALSAFSILLLVLVLLSISACRPAKLSNGADAEGTPLAQRWHTLNTTDHVLTVECPPDWAPVEEEANVIGIEAGQGCVLYIERVDQERADLAQHEVLEQMYQTIENRHAAEGGTVRPMGRRVWMGTNYIWYELHYIVNWEQTCSECRPLYCIDFLAFATETEAVSSHYHCPGVSPPSEEAEQILLHVIDSILVNPPI